MKPAKRIPAVLLGAALLLGSLCACGSSAGTGADTDTNDDSIAQQLYDTDVAAPDLTNATTITLSGTDDVTITDSGVYVLTGTLTDGRVLVNAPDADVTLVLQDADITCADSSALYIYKAASVHGQHPHGRRQLRLQRQLLLRRRRRTERLPVLEERPYHRGQRHAHRDG